jgi:hypothetical protein
MSLKFKGEIDSTTFDNLMEEDENVVYELSYLTFNIKKKLFRFWIPFFPSLKKMKKKAHNMLSLMLDPRLKTFHLMFFTYWL